MTNQEILAAMAKQFMEPEITELGAWYRMDGTNGTEFIPCAYAGKATDVTDPETFADHYSGTIDAVERVKGYGARLSAPGYLDCTEWSVFPTVAEAEQYLVDTYGDDIEEEGADNE